MRLLLTVLLGLLAATLPLRAEEAGEEIEPPPPHTDEQLEEHAVLETFEEQYGSEDMDDRILAVRTLGRWRHKKVLKQLKKIFLKEESLELQAEAATGLGNQTPFAKDAGKVLVKGLRDMEDWATREEPDEEEALIQQLEIQVLVNGFRALGDLGYAKGWDDLEGFIDHPDDEVAGEMMLLCGRLKEYRALKPILEWFNFYPDGYSWSGGSVRVDTGAAGNKDAKAAKAKWKAKYGGRARKARPQAWEMMVQAVEMITGERFETAEQLKEWMEENKALLRRHGA